MKWCTVLLTLLFLKKGMAQEQVYFPPHYQAVETKTPKSIPIYNTGTAIIIAGSATAIVGLALMNQSESNTNYFKRNLGPGLAIFGGSLLTIGVAHTIVYHHKRKKFKSR